MPRREKRRAGVLGDLLHLSAAMDAHKEELPELEPFRLMLGGILAEVLDVGRQQAALTARKQESTKQLRRFLTEGKSLANVIRTAVKHHFGSREEKIAEFGLQPFRGRKAKRASEAPTPSSTPPADAGSASPVKSDP